MNQWRKYTVAQKLSHGRQPYLLSIKRPIRSQELNEKQTNLENKKNLLASERPPLTQRCRFKKLSKIVIACVKWCNWAQRNYKVRIHRYTSFAHINDSYKFLDDLHVDFLQQLMNQKRRAQMDLFELETNEELMESARVRAEMMNFDVDFFKSTKRLNNKITNERIKSILSMINVKRRSRKDVILVEKTIKQIQHMKFLNNLPSMLRTKFIECCWLEEYEPQRILINQNRKPQFFYVIVNGVLLCTYREDNQMKSRTVCKLESGMCIGELSLLEDTIHTVTVSTRDDSQLLVIEKQDFVSIFGLLPNVQLPKKSLIDNNLTVSNSNFILNNVQYDLLEWLKNVSFLRDWPINSLSDQEKSEIRLHRVARGHVLTENTKSSNFIYIVKSGLISVLLRPFSIEDVDHTTETNQLQASFDEEFSTGLSYFPENRELENHHCEVLKNLNMTCRLHVVDESRDSTDLIDQLNHFKSIQNIEEKNFEKTDTLPVIMPPKKPKIYSKNCPKVKLPQLISTSKKPSRHLIKSNKRVSQKDVKAKRTDERMSGLLKVKTIFPGEYCGLNELLFDYQPALQLISYGCECVLFPKSLFLKYANIDQLKELRAVEKSYPDLNSIRFTLRNYSEWNKFKHRVLTVDLDQKLL